MRRTREQWAALVAAFEKTSHRLEQFCAIRGIAPATLRWWRWQLRHTAQRSGHDNGVRLLSVDVVDDSAGSRAASRVVIALSDVEVRFDVGADVEYVATLVARLRHA
jgi:hypothetical protein